MKISNQALLVLILGIFTSSFFLSIPVAAQQTELIFPIFKYSAEQQAFWTILGIKSNDFVAIVDNMELESSKQFVIYAFTPDVANISVQVDIYDSYEVYTDDLGIERVNITQSIEPIVRESYFQKVHRIDLELSEVDDFKLVKMSIGSSYFIFEYKTLWDYQTTTWTNIDFFTQVQLVNWFIILLVAFLALGVAILFVSKARCIPPFTENPIPQLGVIGLGAILVVSGISLRPPNLFNLTAGIFSVALIVCMQLWSSKVTDVKEVLVLDPIKDKSKRLDLLIDKGTVQYIERNSWRDTLFRLLGVYYIIPDFSYFSRATSEGSDFDYLIYGVFIAPQAKLIWRGLRLGVDIIPPRIEYWCKPAARLVTNAIVEDLEQEIIKTKLKDVAKHLEESYKKLAPELEKEPLLFKFPRFRRFLKKIPLVRRLTVYIIPQELIELQQLRQQLIDDIASYQEEIDKLLYKFRNLHERKHDFTREQKQLKAAGEEIQLKDEQIAILDEKLQLKVAKYGERKLKRWHDQLAGNFEDAEKEIDALFDEKLKVGVSKEEVKEAVVSS
ncbi:MAG: hypothetical protein ACFFC7_24685 [Candidatus Hermodarchaeota archaeon]